MEGDELTGQETAGSGDQIDESQIADAGSIDKGTAQTEIQQEGQGKGEGEVVDYSNIPLIELDGVQLTGAEILERFGKLQELEERAGRTKALENEKAELARKIEELQTAKPQVEATKPTDQEATQNWQDTIATDVDWKTIGMNLTEMIEGEQGGVEAIGPGLRAMVIHVADQLFDKKFPMQYGQVKQQEKVVQTFDEQYPDFKEVVESKEYEKFKAANPLFNQVEGYLAFQHSALKREMESLKASGPKEIKAAEEKGKKAGESQTVKQLKAKGNIRLLTGGPGGARPQASRQSTMDLSNEEQRQARMIERLNEMRSGAA